MSMGSGDSQSTEIAGQTNDTQTVTKHGLPTDPDHGSASNTSGDERPERFLQQPSRDLVESDNTTTNITSRSDDEGTRPALPPRPRRLSLMNEHKSPGSSLQVPKRSMRPQLPTQATTAVSLTDIHTQSYSDGTRETFANSTRSTPSGGSFKIGSPSGRYRSKYEREGDESASILSFAPTIGTVGDAESLLGDILGAGNQSPSWRLMSSQTEKPDPFDFLAFENEEPTADFSREFDELSELEAQGDNEGTLNP